MSGRLASQLASISRRYDIALQMLHRALRFIGLPTGLKAEITQALHDIEVVERKHEKGVEDAGKRAKTP